MKPLITPSMSSAIQAPDFGKGSIFRCAAGRLEDRLSLLLQLIVQPRCYQLMAAAIRMIVPLCKTYGGDVLSLVHVGHVDDHKTRFLRHAEGFRRLLLPGSFSYLGKKHEHRHRTAGPRLLDDLAVGR